MASLTPYKAFARVVLARMSRTLLNMEQLYEFMSRWYSDGRSERTVCQARCAFVEKYIARREFAKLFGGYVLSANSSGEEYLGVWSRRKGQRFRRVLRERGAQFMISRESPNLRLKYFEVAHVR